MAHWTNIEEGSYLVEEAFLLTSTYSAMAIEDAIMEVFLSNGNERRVQGHALAINALIVELLEDHDEIDMLLDLGGEFKYLLKKPSISAGKVFSADVKSLIHFTATAPLEKLGANEYRAIKAKLSRVDNSQADEDGN